MIERPRILVFGTAVSVVAPMLLRELLKREAACRYVDLQDFDRQDVQVHFLGGPDGDDVILSYQGSGVEVSAGSVRSAYFRESRLPVTRSRMALHPLNQQEVAGAAPFHDRQTMTFCATVLDWLDARCFCLHPLAASAFAENKLVQLDLARSLGFRIPGTYVGSDMKEIQAFVSAHRRVICKPFHPQNLFYEGHAYKTFTTLVTPEDIAPFAETARPVVLQEAVTPKTDIRVGIVGGRVFATEISIEGARDRESILDFRHYVAVGHLGARKAAYRAHDLPPAVRDRCLSFVRTLGLQYSMMDLLRTPGGDYVFIESNPKGMPGEASFGGHDIIGAMAELLIDPERHRLE